VERKNGEKYHMVRLQFTRKTVLPRTNVLCNPKVKFFGEYAENIEC
jgi:hypothetical protein